MTAGARAVIVESNDGTRIEGPVGELLTFRFVASRQLWMTFFPDAGVNVIHLPDRRRPRPPRVVTFPQTAIRRPVCATASAQYSA